MTSASFAMKLCGFFYIFILTTNAASVGLGNRIDETDSVSKFLSILEDPDRARSNALLVNLGGDPSLRNIYHEHVCAQKRQYIRWCLYFKQASLYLWKRMDKNKSQLALKNAVEVATLLKPDMENLLGIQAEMMWSYYTQLKKEGFTDNQAFELVKNAAPKQLEMKLKKQWF